MEIKQLLLKQMGMLSSVLGLVLGVITIIPFICNFSFFALIVLSAPIILVYMKKLDMIGILDIRQGAMYGAIIGFISFVAFSVSFVPLATIIGFIYKGSYYLGVSLLFRTGFFVLIMMVFFVALLAALMNAFSGLVTIYVYNQLEQKPEESKTDINIEE
ncbi:MAG: hypothetical protein V8R83_00725 [Candidatus Gastranaerophilaceae bacterium]|jgi:hypothetical protein|uniref:Uncharacterized protein n=1 Tax=Candidatus Limenecus avicola TaxID=2840847 RepID=A0A9D1MZ70_9CLOT|nr:hypothetical protein [Clostridium sp.]CDC18000.1 unknown [Clostridium sp. CAG:306]DAB24326.1 MAG TPA: hypothetical protein CPT85_03910 [Candidatus Gastranaerophilales bacterium HUM_21]HIU91771.1 hypothetical protein [Candidatus Limenecus avicola]